LNECVLKIQRIFESKLQILYLDWCLLLHLNDIWLSLLSSCIHLSIWKWLSLWLETLC
jgi:hypothetical protein